MPAASRRAGICRRCGARPARIGRLRGARVDRLRGARVRRLRGACVVGRRGRRGRRIGRRLRRARIGDLRAGVFHDGIFDARVLGRRRPRIVVTSRAVARAVVVALIEQRSRAVDVVDDRTRGAAGKHQREKRKGPGQSLDLHGSLFCVSLKGRREAWTFEQTLQEFLYQAVLGRSLSNTRFVGRLAMHAASNLRAARRLTCELAGSLPTDTPDTCVSKRRAAIPAVSNRSTKCPLSPLPRPVARSSLP